jgi:hypothetical protein
VSGGRALAGRAGGAADTAVSGGRAGAFVVLVDSEGLRHAVRPGSVLALSDGDEAQDTTVAQLPGGRALRIAAPLEEVLAWFS